MKRFSSFLILIMLIICNFGSSEIINLKAGDRKVQKFYRDVKFQINVEKFLKYEMVQIQITPISLFENCSFFQKPDYYNDYNSEIVQVFDMKQGSKVIQQLHLDPKQDCNARITLFTFTNHTENKSQLISAPIPIHIGDTENGQLQLNHVIRYSVSTPQSYYNNKITITVLYNTNFFTPELVPSNLKSFKTSNKSQSQGVYFVLEIEEAKEDLILELKCEGMPKQQRKGFNSYQIIFYDNMSTFKLMPFNKQDFFLRSQNKLQISNFQQSGPDSNVFKIIECEGSLKITPKMQASKNFKTVGKDIWILDKQDTYDFLFETQHQNSYFIIKPILIANQQNGLYAINSTLTFWVNPDANGHTIVQINRITFDVDKLKDGLTFNVLFVINENELEEYFSNECNSTNVNHPKQKKLKALEQKYVNETLISYNLGYGTDHFISVIAYLVSKDGNIIFSNPIVLNKIEIK